MLPMLPLIFADVRELTLHAHAEAHLHGSTQVP